MGRLHADEAGSSGGARASGWGPGRVDRTTIHEQPYLERHRVPGRISIGDYHQYFHGDRKATGGPDLDDGEVDWLATDEWFAYDVVVDEPVESLVLRVASADGFGGGDLGVVVDDDPVTRVQFDATGGWYDWATVDVDLSLTPGHHTLRYVIYDGGWKLSEFALR